MKRIPRDPEKYEAVELFEAIGRKHGFSLNDPKSSKEFLDKVSESFDRDKKNPIILYGKRTEYMFGYVASSLGKCQIIKKEDEGELYTADSNIQVPDWRIVTNSKEEFFVEVKNYHQNDPSAPYSVNEDYCVALENYGKLFGSEVKLAVYWSRWNLWILISLKRIPQKGNQRVLEFPGILEMNQMNLLGDIMIGTTPPLTFRICADLSKPRTVGQDGVVQFTAGGFELYCGGNLIEDDDEKELAFYLMLYGDWQSSQPQANITNNCLESIDYVANPIEPVENQNFDILGALSGMISRKYKQMTNKQGEIARLAPSVEPGSLGILIDKSYKGKSLPLWRMEIRPNYRLRT